MRTAAVSEVVEQAISLLQNVRDPLKCLRKIAILVRDALDASGVKLFVLKRGLTGPCLVQVFRTDFEGFQSKSNPVSPEAGFADWVVRNRTALLVPDLPKDRAPSAPTTCLSLEGDEQRIKPRPESDVLEEAPPAADDEKTMIFLPIVTEDSPAGVLAAWRQRDDLPEPEAFQLADVERLSRLAPPVAAACRLLLQLAASQQQLDAISQLAERLHDANCLLAAYSAVAECMGRLSNARHAILLHHDPDRPGSLYHRASWSAMEEEGEILGDELRGLHIDCQHIPDRWKPLVHERLSEMLAVLGQATLAPSRTVSFPEHAHPLPQMTVILVDFVDPQLPTKFFEDDVLDNTARSFLQYAGTMLKNHTQTYPQTVTEAIGGPRDGGSLDPASMLESAAAILKAATGASGALVYTSRRGELKVTSSVPKREELMHMGVAPGSLTEASITSGKVLRVVDAADIADVEAADLHWRRLEQIRTAFGWREIRSWLCSPILHGERCRGLIKLMTADSDSFLGRDHEEVAKAVSARAAWEIHKMNRHLSLENLNRLAECAQRHGRDLADCCLRHLHKWAAEFIGGNPHVALVVIAKPAGALFRCGTSEFDEKQLRRLEALSLSWGAEEASWGPRQEEPSAGHGDKATGLRRGGVAVPLRLSGVEDLGGHIFLTSDQELVGDDVAALRDAAREAALLLNSERLRGEWRQSVGRFRHALLGPVQGLTSSARLLSVLSSGDVTSADSKRIAEVSARVEREAEIIRLWRINQRLYFSDDVEVRPRKQELRPIVEHCVQRYRSAFQSRNILLENKWVSKGSLVFAFDADALDIALSNLLDNALKYGFFGRSAEVGVISKGEEIHIWVEDEGHQVPAHLAESIYEEHQRLDWSDPLRTIEGEGLGLPMTSRLVKAHGGTLMHTSVELPRLKTTADAAYKVRFTMTLPTYWLS